MNPGDGSGAIRRRVNTVAQAIQIQRFPKRNIHTNTQIGSKDIKR
jgi:hypothetical protein